MKVILYGEHMHGFTNEDTATTPGELAVRAGTDSVVLVCHGTPLETPVDAPDDTPPTCPELLTLNLHALLLAQRTSAASELKWQMLEEYLAGKCERVFMLTVGWNALHRQAGAQESVIAFLKSEDKTPRDRAVQALLGVDLPVTKLALRAALEFVREELERGQASGQQEGKGLPHELLLSPAFSLARREPSLMSNISALEGAVGNRERLRAAVTNALETLAQT